MSGFKSGFQKSYAGRKPVTPAEQLCLENIKMWFDSMRDWFAIVSAGEDRPIEPAGEAPEWVHAVAGRLTKTIFSPVNSVLGDTKLTPYRLGYALGIMKWGKANWNAKPPPIVQKAVKAIRLSRPARKQMYRMLEDFLIAVQIMVRRGGRLEFSAQRELKMANSLARKYSGRDESDFHRGLSDGLRGLGRDAPGDRSTDATDVHLLLMIWWRFIAKLSSVTQLHTLVVRCLGPLRAGDKKRTEKICQRIGLRFRKPGRPKIIQTLALPA